LAIKIDGINEQSRAIYGLPHVAAVASVPDQTRNSAGLVIRLKVEVNNDLFGAGLNGLRQDRSFSGHMQSYVGSSFGQVYLHHLSVPLQLGHLSKKNG